MAVKREIEMVISPDGKVKLTTHGFKGAECDGLSKAVDAFAGKVESRSRTSEYYEKAPVRSQTSAKTK